MDNGWRYYHFDELGSTRLITDGDGEVTDKYAYDAWGNLLSWQRSTGSIDQPYQYVGQLGYYTHFQDPEINLLQLGVRFYDPKVGRFTQRDPAEDGLNPFVYANSQPMYYTDPTGLKAKLCYEGFSRRNGEGFWGCFRRCEGHCLLQYAGNKAGQVAGCIIISAVLCGIGSVGSGGTAFVPCFSVLAESCASCMLRGASIKTIAGFTLACAYQCREK